jgi:hypothetical protein
MVKSRRGGILNQVIIHLVLVGIVLAIFVFATAGKVNARGVKQQVLEKQLALLIDGAELGMRFEINKKNVDGEVFDVEISRGRIYVGVEGLSSVEGYPYFSKYNVRVEREPDKFVVVVE